VVLHIEAALQYVGVARVLPTVAVADAADNTSVSAHVRPYGSQRLNSFVSRNSERWGMRADRVGDLGRRQVRIILFGHSSVGMA
jgi:hypothetical protein